MYILDLTHYFYQNLKSILFKFFIYCIVLLTPKCTRAAKHIIFKLIIINRRGYIYNK